MSQRRCCSYPWLGVAIGAVEAEQASSWSSSLLLDAVAKDATVVSPR
jgi:hypothetical protein